MTRRRIGACRLSPLASSYVPTSCVVPGPWSWPGASETCQHRRNLKNSFLDIPGRLLYTCTYVASCAVSFYTPHGIKFLRSSELKSFTSVPLIGVGNSTIPQAVINTCRRLHLSSQPCDSQDFRRCRSCQHRRSRDLPISHPIFSIVSESMNRSLLTLFSPFTDKIKKSFLANLLFPIHSRQ
jgi:hypothetical protein